MKIAIAGAPQDKIAQNIKACFEQVQCKDGVTYIDNKGCKLENNEWKSIEGNSISKFLEPKRLDIGEAIRAFKEKQRTEIKEHQKPVFDLGR
ncbi:MAG: hypothetical protein LBB59_08320 [Campylobacteraceae bacterium]|jgi:hypothetical protein|nr:hypothetical protein [Campylobacteraceae bacterium]